MFILNRKRIISIIAMVSMAIIVFISSAALEENNTVQTAALPVSSKVIVIDAGHGSPDEGVSLLH